MFGLDMDEGEWEKVELELLKTIIFLSEYNMAECSPEVDERIYNLSLIINKIKIAKSQFYAETTEGV